MSQLWIVRIELTMPLEDSATGNTIGFMNVVTWAREPHEAIEKIRAYLIKSDWHIVAVEECTLVGDDCLYNEDMQDMIDRALGNANAIILGMFHSYPVN